MIKKIKLTVIIFLLLNFTNSLFAENNFYEQGKKKYLEKKYEDSKFLLYEELAALKNNEEIKIEAYINFVKLIDEKIVIKTNTSVLQMQIIAVICQFHVEFNCTKSLHHFK